MVIPDQDPTFNRAYVDAQFALDRARITAAEKKYVGAGIVSHIVHFGYKRANGDWELVNGMVATKEPSDAAIGDYWDINTRDYAEKVKGFSWGDINFTLNGVTKQMVYPRVSVFAENGISPNEPPPFTALDASGASDTAKDEGVPTATQAYIIRPLIYTVQTNSFVILSVYTDMSASPDYCLILFRPNPQSYFDNIWNTHKDAEHVKYRKYPSLFEGWHVLGAQTEIWGQGGDPITSYQIPCQAGAKFAFFRAIFSPGSNLSTVQGSSYSKDIDTTFKGPSHTDTGILGVNFNRTDYVIKSTTPGTTYGWNGISNTTHVKPDSNVVRVLEIPFSAS